jgi:hypothetical protein
MYREALRSRLADFILEAIATEAPRFLPFLFESFGLPTALFR